MEKLQITIDGSDIVVYKGRKVKSAFGGFAYGNGWERTVASFFK